MSASELDAALTSTAHLYARASEKERLLRFFTEVLGLSPRELARRAGVTAKEPMYAVTFSNGAPLSVEFTDDALTDQAAERGAWLELTVTDRAAGTGAERGRYRTRRRSPGSDLTRPAWASRAGCLAIVCRVSAGQRPGPWPWPGPVRPAWPRWRAGPGRPGR